MIDRHTLFLILIAAMTATNMALTVLVAPADPPVGSTAPIISPAGCPTAHDIATAVAAVLRPETEPRRKSTPSAQDRRQRIIDDFEFWRKKARTLREQSAQGDTP